MARVNIITKITDSETPAKLQRVGMYYVEIMNGKTTKHQGMLTRESITGQELTLQLLANALTVIKYIDEELDSIEIYSDCKAVKNAFLNKWIDKWCAEQWKNAKGNDIADKETWMLVWRLLTRSGKRYIFAQEKSRWHDFMQVQLDKELEKLKQKQLAEEAVEKINRLLA